MTKTLRFLAALLSLMIALPSSAEQGPRMYAQAELDQMLAPIALYPDPLLSQILMAATYPLEVAEAARWSRANPGLQGDDAVRAVENEDWDPSVKSLVAFPQVLARMDENRPWTQALGDAFLGQEPQLMDTVQQLRRRAQAAGNLHSSEQIQVQQQGRTIVLLPARPEYVYVPYYDPMVVYGPWWWPAYRPVYWAPWPGYARVYHPGVSVGFWWGAPIGVSARFFFGDFDWRQRHVRVVHVHNHHYYRPPQVVNRTVVVAPNRWQHDPSHRRGVAYRVPEVRQRYAEFQPRTSTEIRRDEQRRPQERHQVLSRPPERQQVQPQVQAQPRVQQRQHQERQQVQQERRQVQQRPQPQAQPQRQHQERQQAQQERRQAQQESRQRMPEAVAPQHPRAEQRQERRESHRERGNKGHKDRS